MLNNCSKLFLIFLSTICVILPAYSMNFLSKYAFTKTQEANKNFENAIKEFPDSENPAQEIINEFFKKIDTSLEQGADINLKINDVPAIVYASRIKNPYLFNHLIDKRADITRCTDLLFSNILKNPDQVKLEKLLQCENVDPNIKILYTTITNNTYSLTPLNSAALHNNTDLMKLLIKYKANIDYRSGRTLLAYTMYHIGEEDGSINGVKNLCQLKASLINIDFEGNSAFHLAVLNLCSSAMISTILTNTRFDGKEIDDEELDRQLKKDVKITLLVFNRLNTPKDIQFLVLDELASEQDIQGYNQKLSHFLYTKGHCKNLIIQAKKRKEKFSEIIKLENGDWKSALDLLNIFSSSSDQELQQYEQNIRPLLTGKKFDDDINDFIQQKGNVSKENLVLAPLYK